MVGLTAKGEGRVGGQARHRCIEARPIPMHELALRNGAKRSLDQSSGIQVQCMQCRQDMTTPCRPSSLWPVTARPQTRPVSQDPRRPSASQVMARKHRSVVAALLSATLGTHWDSAPSKRIHLCLLYVAWALCARTYTYRAQRYGSPIPSSSSSPGPFSSMSCASSLSLSLASAALLSSFWCVFMGKRMALTLSLCSCRQNSMRW